MNEYLVFGSGVCREYLPPVQRPNGKLYRPRKLRSEWVSGDGYWDAEDYVLVLGTHDVGIALSAAKAEVRRHDRSLLLTKPEKVWYHDAIRRGERTWVWDTIRGAAGVIFRPVEA